MARRKKGRDISGWLVVDKPAGPTSTAVVNKVKWAFEARKAGHAGTLDPAATGVLAVALGEATKTVPFVTDALKAYRFKVRWGASTSTDDAEGDILETTEHRPSAAEIERVLPSYVGHIEQVPPHFSAIRIDGARAYDLAREGQRPEIAPRPLFVESLRLTDTTDDCAEFEMVCGKGGYVRSIARDLGRDLGCLGHVLTLRRLWSGPFDVSQGVTLGQVEGLARTPEIDDLLLPTELGLAGLPCLKATQLGASRLKNGNPGEVVTGAEYGDECWAEHGGVPVAVGVYRGGYLHPSRVFCFD